MLDVRYPTAITVRLILDHLNSHSIASHYDAFPLSDLATMRAEVAAWTTDRNNSTRTINWQFTAADARIKLKRLYPPL